MYRVFAIVGAGLILAACESSSTNLDWLKMPSFKMDGALETVRFESEPPGADVKTSTGQTCRAPCTLSLPGDKSFNVTYTLNGFQAETASVAPFAMGDGTTQLRPNPVIAELTPLPPQTKKKMPPKRKPAAKKPAARPVASKPAPAAAAPAPTTTQPAQSNSPWPSPPPSR
jgi:hypothetical protein